MSLTCAEWLATHEIAGYATDTWGTEVIPNETPDVFQPLHCVAIVNMGMLVGEIFTLEALADDCAADGVYEFLFVAPPLPITGAVGLPDQPASDQVESPAVAGQPAYDVRRERAAMFSSRAVTRGIEVSVQSSYVPEQSEPDQQQWFFAYRVRIHNGGDETVQLLTRHWVITDANGKIEEVRGPGVVGKQPTLEPGEAFEYTSACPLGTLVRDDARHLPDAGARR